MNKLLEQAITVLSALPDDEREAIASIILDELRDEALWQQKFARDADKLEAMAEKARAQHARGETLPFDPSDLPA